MPEPSLAGYYRQPTIHGDTVVFVCEDDLWTVPAAGGIARRLTASLGVTSNPQLSPDGRWLAYRDRDEGQPEAYLMPAAGGPGRRLSYLGSDTYVVGWQPDGERIILASSAGMAMRGYSLYTIDREGGEPTRLPIGPAMSLSFAPFAASRVTVEDGSGPSAAGLGRPAVLCRNMTDIARWKRYRGGLTGDMWIDAAGDGAWRRLLRLDGNVAAPLWVGERIYFVSDHEGVGNLYSCTPSGEDLRRHTHHQNFYARHASTDGRRIVYHAGADLFLFDPTDNSGRRIDVDFLSPRPQAARKFVSAASNLNSFSLHPKGHSVAITARGRPLTMPNFDGPVQEHGERGPIRYRLAAWLHDGKRFAVISDQPGEETLEVRLADNRPALTRALGLAELPATGSGGAEPLAFQRFDTLDIGRVVQLATSPKKAQVALTNHRHELLLVDLDAGTLTTVDRSRYERIQGVAWSPDGEWLAYGFAPSRKRSLIRLYQLATGETHDATEPVLRDVAPAWDPDGKYLYFLSYRDFNPVYDHLHFDLGFPHAMRPFLVTLRADLGSPFVPELPTEDDEKKPADDKADDKPGEGQDAGERPAAEAGDRAEVDATDNGPAPAEAKTTKDGEGEPKGESKKEPEPIRIDMEGITRRVVAFPVREGHYGQIRGLKGKALFSSFGLSGTLDTGANLEGRSPSRLESYDFKDLSLETVADGVSNFDATTDGAWVIARMDGGLKVWKGGDRPASGNGGGRKSGAVDLSRTRILVEPRTEWEQMYREAWRLQRDQFWSPDMSGIDWEAIFARYRPLLDRIATRSEFSDLMWEMQGELGTSHAYEFGGDYRAEPSYLVGRLGADFHYDPEAEGYRLDAIATGDVWNERASSPLARPGAGVRPGDLLVAIDGHRLSREVTPERVLLDRVGDEVMLDFIIERPPTSPNGAKPPEAAAQPDHSSVADAPAQGTQPDAEDAGDRSVTATESAVEDQVPAVEPTAPDIPGSPDATITPELPPEPDAPTPAGSTTPSTDVSLPGPPSLVRRLHAVRAKTLSSDYQARYRDWVEGNRRHVHEATEGRVGYIHIPDMGANGYAEFHRGFLTELDRPGLVIDVRFNGGGHVSALLLEKLARRRIGYDVQRWSEPEPYPSEAPVGRMVALTNELAGSDGDIFCHAFKALRLGPLIGTRTWGGVIGISPRHSLIDGGLTTQPEFSFWFEDVGWQVENYGTDPDLVVEIRPQDHAAGRDVQLESAIALIEAQLAANPPSQPDFGARPNLAQPTLPGVEA